MRKLIFLSCCLSGVEGGLRKKQMSSTLAGFGFAQPAEILCFILAGFDSAQPPGKFKVFRVCGVFKVLLLA